MREYLLRVKGAEFPHLDPEIKMGHMEKNPFGFTFGFKVDRLNGAWTTPNGKTMWLSPEPPGLQVSFEGTSKEEEQKRLNYLQRGIDKETVIIQIQ